uniref:Uncharacterized protein n=1 Tax=Rhizophora mucronata TaxID=61149 RepID=A0A2P2P4Y4_RHIMU
MGIDHLTYSYYFEVHLFSYLV